MSTTARPISPTRFAAAIKELPLSSLHEKAAELRNSQKHLHESNAQLQEYAEHGDQDCVDAIRENEEVIARIEDRVALLRNEVEVRGFLWSETGESVKADASVTNGDAGEHQGVQWPARTEGVPSSGRLTDAELAQRLREQMEDVGDDDDGVHL